MGYSTDFFRRKVEEEKARGFSEQDSAIKVGLDARKTTVAPNPNPTTLEELEKGTSAEYRGEYGKAILHSQNAANKGSSEAAYRIGLMYKHGYGVLQNHSMASSWFTKATKKGHVRASLLSGTQQIDANKHAVKVAANIKNKNNSSLCGLALNATSGGWDEDFLLRSLVNETESRGLSVQDCNRMLDRP